MLTCGPGASPRGPPRRRRDVNQSPQTRLDVYDAVVMTRRWDPGDAEDSDIATEGGRPIG